MDRRAFVAGTLALLAAPLAAEAQQAGFVRAGYLSSSGSGAEVSDR
jgi:hypothetical protein